MRIKSPYENLVDRNLLEGVVYDKVPSVSQCKKACEDAIKKGESVQQGGDYWLKHVHEKQAEYREIFSDSATIQSMAAAALRAEEQSVQFMLSLARIGNQIPQGVLQSIIKEHRLSEKAVKALVSKAKLKVVKEAAVPECESRPQPAADSLLYRKAQNMSLALGDARNITDYVQVEGKTDIFAYTGLSQSTTPETLQKWVAKVREDQGTASNKDLQSVSGRIRHAVSDYLEKNAKPGEKWEINLAAFQLLEVVERTARTLRALSEEQQIQQEQTGRRARRKPPREIPPYYYTEILKFFCNQAIDTKLAENLLYHLARGQRVQYPWREQVCPKCKSRVPENKQICPDCGTRLSWECPYCGRMVSDNKEVTSCHCGRQKKEITAIHDKLGEVRKLIAAGLYDRAAEELAPIISACSRFETARSLKKELISVWYKAILAQLQPPVITQLQATKKALSISWTRARYLGKEIDELPNPISEPIRYTLRRALNAIPQSENDGEEVAELHESGDYLDTGVEICRNYGYRIFAQIGQHVLKSGGLVGMVLPTPNLNLRVSDASIDLTWEPVPPDWEITLIRKLGGAPANANDGERLTVRQRNSYHDEGLTNGRVYGYLLILSCGSRETSETVTGVPMDIPEPVPSEAWTWEQQGRNIVIRYAETDRKEEIFWFVGPTLPAKPGHFCSASALQEKYKTLRDGGQITILDASARGQYIVPLICKKQKVYVSPYKHGGAQMVELYRDLGELDLTISNPEPCQEVLVVISHKEFASSPRDYRNDKTFRRITPLPGEKTAKLQLHNLGDKPCYLTVYLGFEQGTETFWSSPRRICSLPPGMGNKLTFRIIRLSGENNYGIEVASSEGVIPAMTVRCSEGHFPTGPTAGTFAFNIPATRGKRVLVPIPAAFATEGFCFMPFVDDQDDALSTIKIIRRKQLIFKH